MDFQRFYKSTATHNAFTGSAHAVTGEAAAQKTFRVSTYLLNELIAPYYLLTPKELPGMVSNYIQKTQGWPVSAAGMGSLLYSDFRYNGYVSREEGLRLVTEALAALQTARPGLTVGQGNGYTLPYAARVTDTPLMDSGYDISATDVPFYALVLHGCLDLYAPAYNLSEEQDTLLLRLLETGVNPAFALTWEEAAELRDTRYEFLLSTEWALQKDTILALWQTWQDVMDGLNGQMIVDHLISGDLRRITYEDGTKIYVNYGWTDAALDGVTVPARGYQTVKGGN